MESNKIGAATAFATVLFLIVRSERKQSSYSITFQFLSLSLSLTLLLVGQEGAHLAYSGTYSLGLHLRVRPVFSIEV